MKKLILLTVISALPLGMMAQDDDMYFVPTKENVAKELKSYGMPKNTYYSGSERSIDEYNRSQWTAPKDSAGNDIIDFSAVRGVYPDSTYSGGNDYQLTRRMQRFDDYNPSEAYWEGYRDGRWSSPWYYSSYYPWYDPWYDPWYTPWYSWRYHYAGWGWSYGWGWYGGYYYPWYGYYRPYRHVVPSYRHYDGRNRVSAGGYRGYSNGSYARSQRRSTAPTRGFGQTPGSRSSSYGGGGSFGGGNRSFGGGGGSFGGGGGRSSGGGGRSLGTRR